MERWPGVRRKFDKGRWVLLTFLVITLSSCWTAERRGLYGYSEPEVLKMQVYQAGDPNQNPHLERAVIIVPDEYIVTAINGVPVNWRGLYSIKVPPGRYVLNVKISFGMGIYLPPKSGVLDAEPGHWYVLKTKVVGDVPYPAFYPLGPRPDTRKIMEGMNYRGTDL